MFATIDRLTPKLRGPRILIYHQVGVDFGREMEVSERDFVGQLDWLRENGRVVDLASALAGGPANGDLIAVLTFDDGYRDLYDTAFPHLLERRLPFTLYLTTGPVETGTPLSDHRALPLTWDQILEMLSSGLLTLGSHTHTHPDLRQSSPESIRWELEESDRLIELRTQVAPSHFAYPWGYWSSSADKIVRPRFETAAVGAPIRPETSRDHHRLARVPIQKSDGMRFFGARMNWGLRAEERLRRLVRGYREL